MVFEPDVFRQHIYQEIRLQRFYNYLHLKREQKKAAEKKAREKARKQSQKEKKKVRKANRDADVEMHDMHDHADGTEQRQPYHPHENDSMDEDESL